MSTDVREYHRTFLHWPRRGGMADFALKARQAAENTSRQPRSNAPAAPSMGAPSGTERDTRKFHRALITSGSHFEEVTIQEKSDQKFEQHATPWERKWSRLVDPRNSRGLSPVVDGNAAVVGYAGVVKGSDLLIGRANGIAIGLLYTPAETLKYHQMFVGNDKTLHTGADLDVYQSEWVYISVLTDVYGEVTAFEFSHRSNNGEAEPTDFPVWGWLKQIHGGLKALISLRNGFRTLVRQRTLPPPAPRQLPPGPPATPTGGSLPRLGSQTMASHGAPIPVPRPRGRFDTTLGEAVNNIRRHLGLPPLPMATVQELHAKARAARATKELHEWLVDNANAPFTEKMAVMDRIYARWRVPVIPYE